MNGDRVIAKIFKAEGMELIWALLAWIVRPLF